MYSESDINTHAGKLGIFLDFAYSKKLGFWLDVQLLVQEIVYLVKRKKAYFYVHKSNKVLTITKVQIIRIKTSTCTQ